MNKKLTLILLVLLIGLFFRSYQVVERYDYAHDADLFSWIAKDIIVNKHLRLVGQLTSAPGIFIGPLYYYLNVPFFLLTNMDPVGAIIPITIIGILAMYSYFWVLSKLFNPTVGLIAAFLYAVLLSNVQFDRRIAPSTPTNIWVIWYFYTIISIARGNFKILPLLGILIGLIWHIHIALIPALIAIPISLIVAKRLPKLKQILYFLIALTVTSLPLVLFESRHGFQQTRSLIDNFTQNHGGGVGEYKLFLVLEMITKNLNTLLLSPQQLPAQLQPIVVLLLILLGIFIISKKLLSLREIFPLSVWIAGVIMFFSVSSSLISEYYFYNIEIIFVTIVSLSLAYLSKLSKVGGMFVLVLLSFIFLKNFYFFITADIYHKGYLERKAVANYITEDAKKKGYPCVGITYIATLGENVGFRYFFYLDNLHIVHPSLKVPTYNIAIPDELAVDKKDAVFGHIGVIVPKFIPPQHDIQESCKMENTNLTDPLFGYVD